MGINEVVQIGSRIKKYRKSKGITQKEAALCAGIPYSTYSNYENNNREPNREQLQKIADALNVPLYELMGFDGSIRVHISPEHIEVESLIKKRASGKEITEEEYKKISDYIKRTNESIPRVQEAVKNLNSTIEELQENIMISDYRKLNNSGKEEARKRVNELTEIPRYTKPDDPPRE